MANPSMAKHSTYLNVKTNREFRQLTADYAQCSTDYNGHMNDININFEQ